MRNRMHGFGTGDPFGQGWASIGRQRLVAEGLVDDPFGPRRDGGTKAGTFGRFVERFGNGDAMAIPHVDDEVAGIFVVEGPDFIM